MKALIAILAVLAGVAASQARIITVDDDGPADFNSIQPAVEDANDGDTILVAAGTYYENIRVLRKEGINLIGAGADVTTIDGSTGGSTNVVGYNTASGEISGFTIANSAHFWRGVFASHSTVTIRDNIIRHNYMGISISSDSDALIFGNRIINNAALYAAVRILDSNATIINNTVAENSGYGIYCRFGSGSIINNTITGNMRGIFTSPREEQVITNNIITQNEYGITAAGGDESTVPLLIISYNDLWDNSEADYWEFYGEITHPVDRPFSPSPGTGERHEDPLFADAANGDYHLKSQAGRWDANDGGWTIDDETSPCIDRGNPATPIGHEPFPNGARINMGAYGGTNEASKAYFGGLPCETIVAGDINGDCEVNYLDFRIMASHWLEDRN
ncbi:MAG: right-handed parallel beta-helix repeat-containing protein [Phycisphaerae bacterium]|nr:right-handed parallel beta-helix repeat-containing protein [Phycisphaerae bacterium]